MGCYTMACAITNLPIKENDEVFAILMFQSQTSDGSSTIWYATPIMFKAKYDGYGGVTDVHESYERLMPFFKEYLETRTTTARFSGEGKLSEQFSEVISRRHLLNNGFTINLSAENMDQVDEYVAMGIAPVVTILPMNAEKVTFTPNGNKVVRCPANETITCKTCKLCQRAERDFVIGFTAHGSRKKKVEKIALQMVA